MTRPPKDTDSRSPSQREIIVDLFAGGGGASTGIYMATGRHPDAAINHSPAAVAFHTRHHPTTKHYCEDIFDVDPMTVMPGRKIGLLWASPDCTHHSRAKGGKPRDRKRRALAMAIVRWVAMRRPRVVKMENVPEFTSWGPLDDEGYPIPERAGELFHGFIADLELQGYAVEWRELCAADYGAPTTRSRWYLIARCDGRPIVWPEPTHGVGRALPWRTAAECIDFALPTPSIFLSPAEAKAWARSQGRKQPPRRPLADKTLARIARGLDRFVLSQPEPFVVTMRGTGPSQIAASPHSFDDPLGTVTAGGIHHAVVDPYIVPYGTAAPDGVREPLATATTHARFALVAPTIYQSGYGERPGQAPRILDLHQPLGTAVAGGSKVGVVASWMVKHYGGNEGPGTPLSRSLDTITCRDHHALAVASFFGDRVADVRALIQRFCDFPDGDQRALGLVNVGGALYQIADIGMRMLQWRELFRAQGFPESGIVNVQVDGAWLKDEELIELAGNSVCPPVAEALVRANFDAATPRVRRRTYEAGRLAA